MGLLIWQSITLFDPNLQLKNNFALIAGILLLGFLLVSFTSALFIEKKINKNFLFIKNSLLHLVENAVDSNPTGKKQNFWQEITIILPQIKNRLIEDKQLMDKENRELVQKEKMAALSHFSTAVAHEINNPLAAILGHAQLAKGKSVDLPVQKHLDIIEKEIRKIKGFIRDIMRFSKNIPSDYKSLNSKQMILEIIDLMEPQLTNKSIQVQKHLASTQEIQADAMQLQQVLVNLINNAIYAMERSHEKILTIHTKDLRDKIRIQVHDTGIGIPSDIEDKVFEPFFTTKTPQEGKGLGLAICFGIIKGHKGTLYLDSKVNKGTTFTIDLPCQISLGLQNQQAKAQEIQNSSSPSQQNLHLSKTDYPNHTSSKLADMSTIANDPQEKSEALGQISKENLTQTNPKTAVNAPNIAQNIQFHQQDTSPQINHSITKKQIPFQKPHFSVQKDSMSKTKTLEFKVKIRPPKIKEQ